MATADKNLRVPDELLHQAQRIAETQGRSAGDLAVDALKRYMETQENVQALNELSWWGERHACERGFRAFDVERAISDVRRGR